jgi:hypothetical protein
MATHEKVRKHPATADIAVREQNARLAYKKFNKSGPL